VAAWSHDVIAPAPYGETSAGAEPADVALRLLRYDAERRPSANRFN